MAPEYLYYFTHQGNLYNIITTIFQDLKYKEK